MTLWLRKWTCTICKDYVVYDDKKHILRCSCAPISQMHFFDQTLIDNFLSLSGDNAIFAEVLNHIEELKRQLEKKV